MPLFNLSYNRSVEDKHFLAFLHNNRFSKLVFKIELHNFQHHPQKNIQVPNVLSRMEDNYPNFTCDIVNSQFMILKLEILCQKICQIQTRLKCAHTSLQTVTWQQGISTKPKPSSIKICLCIQANKSCVNIKKGRLLLLYFWFAPSYLNFIQRAGF